MAPPIYGYPVLRPWLTTGAVILWQGRSLLSRAIRLFTPYSHASLVVRGLDDLDRNRVFLVEALETGLELRLLSERVKGYNGRVFAFRPYGLTKSAQGRVKSFAIDQCARGIRYDYKGLLANIFGRVSEDARRYFCSEFAALALEQAGVYRSAPFLGFHAARPGDIPKWFVGETREIEVPR